MQQKIVTIFGATGYLGRSVVRHFAALGYIVRAVSRSAQKSYFLRVYGDVGQIVPMAANYADSQLLAAVLQGADVAVYLPGLLYGSKKSFERVHLDYPALVAEACAGLRIPRFVHVSALGCERSQAVYAQTKHAGEMAVLKAYPQASIIRPSIIFGPEDGFFGRFAKMAQVLPFLPLIGGGFTKFQPVYVEDVAKAIVAAAVLPARGPQNPLGRIYELGGPAIYSFKTLLEMMCAQTGQKPLLVPIPFALATVKAMFLQLLPVPPLTVDQVRSLKTDNIVAVGSFGLVDLGVAPTALAGMLPVMLKRYRAGGPCVYLNAEQKQVM